MVLAAGVQLRQQGARVMSNKLKDIVLGRQIKLFNPFNTLLAEFTEILVVINKSKR